MAKKIKSPAVKIKPRRFKIVTEQMNQIDPDKITNYRKLVWSDEFDGDEINTKLWEYDSKLTGWSRTWNHEWQDYTVNGKGGSNAFVKDSCLYIRALHPSKVNGPGKFTSARLKTKVKYSWKYGRFAARIKLPFGNGMWPAFWMKGINREKVGWPKCGEIDIMEMIGGHDGKMRNGGDDKIYGALHGPSHHGFHCLCRGVRLKTGTFHDDFHIFEVNWNRDSITWLLDGKPYHQVLKNPENEWVYDHPFMIILNLAVGGKWPGYPNTSNQFPQEMAVDWVRIYQ
jgi:beta-glucanase (GH16 family)